MLEETHKCTSVITKTGRQAGTRCIKTDVTHGFTGVSNQLAGCIMIPRNFMTTKKRCNNTWRVQFNESLLWLSSESVWLRSCVPWLEMSLSNQEMSLAGWNLLHNQKMKVKPQASCQKKQIFLRLCHKGEWDVLLSCRAAESRRKPRVQKACRQACVAATNCYFLKIVLIPNECCCSATWHCNGTLGGTNTSLCFGYFSAMSI